MRVVANKRTLRHATVPLLLATPDAFVVPDGMSPEYGPDHTVRLPAGSWGLEVKTAFSAGQVKRWGQGGDQVPEEYLLQCSICHAVCDLERWDMAVLLATYHGAEYRQYTLKRDMALEARLIEIAEQFWHENVEARLPPHPSGYAIDDRALKALYADVERATILADVDQSQLLADYAEADDWVKERDRLKQMLKAEIGSAEGLEDDFYRALWPETKTGRRFTLTRKKEGA